jgi:hypothetical protein
VVGQTFTITASEAASLAVGDYIVAGAAPHSLAVVYQVGVPYVSGISVVRVKGPVDEVNSVTGRLTIGSLAVDYTSQLSAKPGLAPAAGDVVDVAGIQPLSGGALIVGSSANALTLASSDRR